MNEENPATAGFSSFVRMVLGQVGRRFYFPVFPVSSLSFR